MSDIRYDQAIAALMAAARRMVEEDPTITEDDKLFHDMLEGDPDAGAGMDMLHRMVRYAVRQKRLADDATEYAKDVRERADRFKRRNDNARAAVFAAMDALGLRKLEAGDFTATVRAGNPAVVITDEDALTDTYVRIKREPDKTAIADALKNGLHVLGAELSNGSPSIQVRTR